MNMQPKLNVYLGAFLLQNSFIRISSLPSEQNSWFTNISTAIWEENNHYNTVLKCTKLALDSAFYYNQTAERSTHGVLS